MRIVLIKFSHSSTMIFSLSLDQKLFCDFLFHSDDRNSKLSIYFKMASKTELVREQIVHFFVLNPTFTYKKISKSLDVPISTVGRVLKRYKESSTTKRKQGSGRKKGPVNKKLANSIKRSLDRNPGLSLTDLSKKFGTSRSYIVKVKKHFNIRTRKCVTVPKRSDEQLNRAISRSKVLYQMLLRKPGCLIMDDETYVKKDFQQLPGLQFYSERVGNNIPESFKVVRIEKFAKKIMVWQAICECGMKSTPFLTEGTINADVYVKECLQKRLLPLVKKHGERVLFWPDLATSHYARSTLDWYQKNDITVVPKLANPPNCPELRPIEIYWAIIKRYLKKTKRTSISTADFKKKWFSATNRLDKDHVQRLMSRVTQKVRDFRKKIKN